MGAYREFGNGLDLEMSMGRDGPGKTRPEHPLSMDWTWCSLRELDLYFRISISIQTCHHTMHTRQSHCKSL